MLFFCQKSRFSELLLTVFFRPFIRLPWVRAGRSRTRSQRLCRGTGRPSVTAFAVVALRLYPGRGRSQSATGGQAPSPVELGLGELGPSICRSCSRTCFQSWFCVLFFCPKSGLELGVLNWGHPSVGNMCKLFAVNVLCAVGRSKMTV